MLIIVGLENIPELAYAGEPLKKIVSLPDAENIIVPNSSEYPDGARSIPYVFRLRHCKQARNESSEFFSTIAGGDDIFHNNFFIKNWSWSSLRINDSSTNIGNETGCLSIVLKCDPCHRLSIHWKGPFFLVKRTIPRCCPINTLKEIVVQNDVKSCSFSGYRGLGGFFGSIGGFLSSSSGTDRGVSCAPHFDYGTAHITSLKTEREQLQKEDEKSDYANENLIARISNEFFIGRSLESRLCILLLGIGLLFGGGYNIYRERFVWGTALFGGGALLGFWSLISWGMLS